MYNYRTTDTAFKPIPLDDRQRAKLKNQLGDKYYNYCGMPVYAVLDEGLAKQAGYKIIHIDQRNASETILFYFIEISEAYSDNCYDLKSMD